MPNLQLVLIAAAIISTSWAQDGNLTLTLTAKEAVKLYIDGVFHETPNERNMSLTDSVPVSSTSRILAFQSINLASGCPGIIASITGDYFLSNSSWKCFDISGGEDWINIGFDDSQWPNATEHRPNIDQSGGDCSNLPHMPLISENAFWVWMEDTVQDIIYCRGYLPVCSSSPCKNGATCNINEVEQCTCAAGFTGTYCETEVDECASAPCLNSATCRDLLNGFECTCVAGYTGIRCETDVYECASTPCLNNGTCEDYINGYQCICPANYTGQTCETKVDDCFSLPCKNGGTCVANSDSGYTCSCPNGFTGSNCETVSTVMLIVTADRSLSSLYVDNVYYEVDISSSVNWSIPDHIAIPATSSLIALRASNSFDADCSGILGSIGVDFVTDGKWKCSTDNSQGWYRTDFNDSHWPQAVVYDSNTPPFLCHHRNQIPEISASAKWIWTSDMSVSINCRAYLGDSMELVLTGDRSVIALYIDGSFKELNSTTSNTWSQTERLLIPTSTTLIAIRANDASNSLCSGILSSVGNYYMTDVTWKCSTDNSPGWYDLGFDDSAWPNAADYGLNSPPFQCPYRYELPEISSSAHWIYTEEQSVPANCRGYLPQRG